MVLRYAHLAPEKLSSIARRIERQSAADLQVRPENVAKSATFGELSRFWARQVFDWIARPDGFEPPTTWFEARCSIQLSYGRVTDEFSGFAPHAAGVLPTACLATFASDTRN
jgi:hypothetical protein